MHKSTLEEYVVVEMTYEKGQLARKTATESVYVSRQAFFSLPTPQSAFTLHMS